MIMNNNNRQPIQAEITEIRATAEEAKRLRAALQKKVTVIQNKVSKIQLPQGPAFINGRWW